MKHEVRCAGCRRRVGYSNIPNTGRIWCSDVFCSHLSAPTGHETRDDVAFLLYKLGRSVPLLAAKFAVTTKRIHQIIQQRSTS